MRYRGSHRLGKWLEQGGEKLLDARKDDLQVWYAAQRKSFCLEIGCGKGGFLQTMAKLHPDTTFVGVDKMLAVAAKAAAGAARQGLSNTTFIVGDIGHIGELWHEPRVARIYLNFSDPWPRRRHYDRRLTHAKKLALYAKWLCADGWLEQKTDNLDLFNWSLASLAENGWDIAECARAFAEGEPDGTSLSSKYVQTEYEAKFRSMGLPIYYLRARPKQAE
ncbi:tRNA (guanine-N(7)-)-methyltransferase [Alicyclobacillus hesperidum]|uniref:tRNA (guanine-N(7)-)-methyltransferase n=1 Tax=Alicyclobacillus hesperidum TaxID=89784 RepID=A0AA37X4S0_9BACL|nr:tRNA (guanosine(46)-N7)-methyltransferase TrmB [Alicyclobacillus hesperidum]GLV13403.1 tRNA (guanine-N(7)-)-methyltransferase [Alicyclobacillus hesperidum]